VAVSRFITLKDIAAIVEEGHEVSVEDNETGEDVTELTLVQVLLERAKAKKELAAVPMLLHQLVRAGHTVVGDFIRNSVLVSIKTLAMTEEDVAELVQTLALRGHLRKEEAAELNEMLLKATRQQQALLDERIKRVVTSRLEAMGLGDKLNLIKLIKTVGQSLVKQADKTRAGEISELKARVGTLQDHIRTLSKKVGSTPLPKPKDS
jgi:polyhydroxyalkanoate synthesis regulator protein